MCLFFFHGVQQNQYVLWSNSNKVYVIFLDFCYIDLCDSHNNKYFHIEFPRRIMIPLWMYILQCLSKSMNLLRNICREKYIRLPYWTISFLSARIPSCNGKCTNRSHYSITKHICDALKCAHTIAYNTNRINISIANKWNRSTPANSWKLNNSNNHKKETKRRKKQNKWRRNRPNNINKKKWCAMEKHHLLPQRQRQKTQ